MSQPSLEAINLKTRIEYDVNRNAIYVGEAEPGTAEDVALWRIKKITYDVNNNATAVDWADGTKAMVKKWSERSTGGYVYA